jgi:hypothetical protein
MSYEDDEWLDRIPGMQPLSAGGSDVEPAQQTKRCGYMLRIISTVAVLSFFQGSLYPIDNVLTEPSDQEETMVDIAVGAFGNKVNNTRIECDKYPSELLLFVASAFGNHDEEGYNNYVDFSGIHLDDDVCNAITSPSDASEESIKKLVVSLGLLARQYYRSKESILYPDYTDIEESVFKNIGEIFRAYFTTVLKVDPPEIDEIALNNLRCVLFEANQQDVNSQYRLPDNSAVLSGIKC